MDIKGYIPLSLVEFPRRVAAVVFVGGCNLRCGFCYNRDLVLRPHELETIPTERVLSEIGKHADWLDGVAITGGEPTLQENLLDFMKAIKDLGLEVELETNGTKPEVIREAIAKGLVDYVAMDVKAPLEYAKYAKVAGSLTEEEFKAILKSIELLREGAVDYEFRTTVVPGLVTLDDVVKIAEELKGAKRYIINQFLPRNTIDEKLREVRPYKPEELRGVGSKIADYFEHFDVRGI